MNRAALLNCASDLYNHLTDQVMPNAEPGDTLPGRSLSAGEIYIEMKLRLEQGERRVVLE